MHMYTYIYTYKCFFMFLCRCFESHRCTLFKNGCDLNTHLFQICFRDEAHLFSKQEERTLWLKWLQHTATHINTLQHAATRHNTVAEMTTCLSSRHKVLSLKSTFAKMLFGWGKSQWRFVDALHYCFLEASHTHVLLMHYTTILLRQVTLAFCWCTTLLFRWGKSQ